MPNIATVFPVQSFDPGTPGLPTVTIDGTLVTEAEEALIRQEAANNGVAIRYSDGTAPPNNPNSAVSFGEMEEYVADQNDEILTRLARSPDLLIAGAVTRDANGAVTSAPVIWPDGTAGVYTALTLSVAFPGAVDSYKVTYGHPVATKTITQPAMTRDSTGAVSVLPELVVT